MKLIVSHLEALRTYVTREFYYITTDLMLRHGWKHIETSKLWNGPGTISEKLIREFGEMPETILFWEAYEFLEAHASEIYRLKSHKFFLTDDLHWRNAWLKRIRMISFALCDTILSTNAFVWNRFYPEFCGTKKVVWIPHAASPDFMLPYDHSPENSIFLSGALSWHYPLRRELMKLHSEGSYSIAYHSHPGYHCGFDYRFHEDIGPGYARKINHHRAGFTDSSIYQYVVAKYFEIPATGALLLADDAVSGLLEKLGFIENEHYVPVSKENLAERVRYVLDEKNHDELDEIRRRGQELVWERHKTSDRAKKIDDACRS